MNDASRERPAKPYWDRMAEIHPRRSLLMFALGTAFGLSVAAYGLFSAAGTRVAGVPAEDVALVNGRHILKSDFITQTQLETSLPYEMTTKEQRLKVLNEMLDEELLVQRGLEVDLAASDPDVRMAEVMGVQLQIDADVLAQAPSDEELQKYYEAHKDKYNGEGIMALRDLVIRPTAEMSEEMAMAKAKAAADAFRQGRDSGDIAATFDLRDSGRIERGDVFEFAVKIKLAPALYAAAQKLKAKEASDPIKDGTDVHVILMEKRAAAVERSFAQVRDAVLQDYKKEATARVESANLSYLKSKADIQLAPEFRP
ncbi:MAG TPA: peptidyl-prolyl cis-trans isomerase [Micropepsaceae bacterium]|nr:peptidyl-prolyl cis-trans isomerase [Micropepsaceae bacterium]